MIISCFPGNETQLRTIVERLKQEGLTNQYNEQAHGEAILLSVHTRTLEEREKVTGILEDAGIWEIRHIDESAA